MVQIGGVEHGTGTRIVFSGDQREATHVGHLEEVFLLGAALVVLVNLGRRVLRGHGD